MLLSEQYAKYDNCYIGEIDGYGYAFVPGSDVGVVILDIITKRLLENLSIEKSTANEKRIELLLKNKLIHPKKYLARQPELNHKSIKSISTWLHVSNSCNLSCNYCYIAGKCGGKFMSLEIAKQYLDKLEYTAKEHGLKAIVIRFGGGEPMLRKDVVEFVCEDARRRFEKHNISIQFILLTNGTLLNNDWLKILSRFSIRVCISLDGIDEYHNKIRYFQDGSGSFKRIYRNLMLCLEADIHPRILTTITEQNISGILELGQFLIDANLPFRFGVYRDNCGKYFGYEQFIRDVCIVLDNCYDYYADAIRIGKASFLHQLSDIHIDNRPHIRSCNIGYSGITVNHEGKVFLCQAGMDKEPIGNIQNNGTFLEMLKFQKVMPELNSIRSVRQYVGCDNCQWALVCGGGCPMINYSANGRIAISSPYCQLFQTMLPRLIELKALQSIYRYKNTIS